MWYVFIGRFWILTGGNTSSCWSVTLPVINWVLRHTTYVCLFGSVSTANLLAQLLHLRLFVGNVEWIMIFWTVIKIALFLNVIRWHTGAPSGWLILQALRSDELCFCTMLLVPVSLWQLGLVTRKRLSISRLFGRNNGPTGGSCRLLSELDSWKRSGYSWLALCTLQQGYFVPHDTIRSLIKSDCEGAGPSQAQCLMRWH